MDYRAGTKEVDIHMVFPSLMKQQRVYNKPKTVRKAGIRPVNLSKRFPVPIA